MASSSSWASEASGGRLSGVSLEARETRGEDVTLLLVVLDSATSLAREDPATTVAPPLQPASAPVVKLAATMAIEAHHRFLVSICIIRTTFDRATTPRMPYWEKCTKDSDSADRDFRLYIRRGVSMSANSVFQTLSIRCRCAQ